MLHLCGHIPGFFLTNVFTMVMVRDASQLELTSMCSRPGPRAHRVSWDRARDVTARLEKQLEG